MASTPDENRLSELEAKWLNGTITDEEAKEYADWYNQDQDLPVHVGKDTAASEEAHRRQMLHRINSRRQRPASPVIRLFRAGAAAAALVVLLGGLYLYHRKDRHPAGEIAQAPKPALLHDVAPGRTTATLTLSNGKTIVLDPASKGMLGQDNGVKISNADSSLTYRGAGAPGPLAYNTLSTAKGEQYSVILSDGTKVWLNAASELKFPVKFTGGERRVEVRGEAYFEVARNVAQPFYVSSGNMHLQVLGTSFDINAYADEPAIRTTLLEGAVKINDKVGLLPRQQSRIAKDGGIQVVRNVDVDETVAWKNGAFSFNNADITTVMRQLERWYDIEVVYEGNKPTDVFYGGISRASTLMEVLKILQVSKVHFRLEGKKLIVLS